MMPAGTPKPLRVAVLGGGVAGCSLVHGLRQIAREEAAAGPTGSPDASSVTIRGRRLEISLFEMGRGVGGRAATRMSREMPGMMVDHGVPHFEARSERFCSLMESLLEKGHLERFQGTCGVLRQASSGASGSSFVPETQAPTRYRGKPGMSGLCKGLIQGVEESVLTNKSGTMVTGLEKLGGNTGWRLFSKDSSCLGEFDWLAVSGNGVAHPRWSKAFPGEPPLIEAAKSAKDEILSSVLGEMAKLSNRPVTVTMMAFSGQAAAAWAALPFSFAVIEDDPVLAKIAIRTTEEGNGGELLTSVVVHSTHEFSEGVSDVYGATSTAARVGGASTGSANSEADVIATMLSALKSRISPVWLTEDEFNAASWGPHLHRWGAAFPAGPKLPASIAVLPLSRLAFCGDYVATDGPSADSNVDDLEAAVLSGLKAARSIADNISTPDEPSSGL